MNSDSNKRFLKGALLLSAASLVCKALSAVFKIPLDRFFIGPEGIGIYQSANTVFNWMLAVGATGIPMAVSNLVAAGDEKTAARIRSSALCLVTAAGALAAAVLFAFAHPLAAFIAGSSAAPAETAIRVMSVGILFLGVVSSYKGYFQGRGNMLPSAVSQIADSLCKAVGGLSICALLLPKGIEIAAAGAISGVSIGTAAGATILLLFGRKSISVYAKPSLKEMRRIFMLSVPVTLGAAGFACVMLSDTLTVQGILVRNGFTTAESATNFGYLTRAFMIYNLPATLISAVTMSVAPASAESRRSGDSAALRENAVSAVRLIMLISVPCMLGVMSFPREILRLLYKTGEGSELLMLTGILMLLIPFTQVLSGILQATGCVWKPIMILGCTVGVKTVLNYILVPVMGIVGSPFATVTAYAAGCAAFVYLFRRHLGFGFPAGAFLRPAAAAVLGIICGKVTYALLKNALGFAVGFAAAVAVTAIVYAVGALLFGALTAVKRQSRNF